MFRKVKMPLLRPGPDDIYRIVVGRVVTYHDTQTGLCFKRQTIQASFYNVCRPKGQNNNANHA